MEEKKTQVHIADMYPVMKEQLEAGGRVEFTPQGISMLPLIVPGRDTVVLVKAPDRLKKYDLPLYQRASGQFVLHRVVNVEKGNSYTMCGDNQYAREPGIPHSAVIGVVEELIINGKRIKVTDKKYMRYCRTQVLKKHMRQQLSRIYHKSKRILKQNG